MTDDEIVYLINAHCANSGDIFDVIIFARAIEHCTLTKQKARWYQEGLVAENTQAQELFGKTEQLEAEIKRLQELADYRLKLLTKMPSEWVGLTDQEINDCLTFNFYRLTLLTEMPSEWVGLTDEDIAELRCHGAHSVSDTDFRAIEAKLKEKNHA